MRASTVTTLTYTSLHCYHTELYLSVLLSHRAVPAYCYLSRGWLGRAMVLGSFQCQGIVLLWHIVGQGPAVLVAGAGWVGCFVLLFFFHLVYSIFPFLMPHLLGDDWTGLKYCGLGHYNPTVVVSYYRSCAH